MGFWEVLMIVVGVVYLLCILGAVIGVLEGR